MQEVINVHAACDANDDAIVEDLTDEEIDATSQV